MNKVFTFSPTFMLFFCVIIQAFILVIYVLIPKNHQPKDEKSGLWYELLMHFGFTVPFIFGFIFIDTAIFWLFGQWMYSDWQFQLPTVIFLLLLGFQYVLSIFINPKVFDLIYGIITMICLFLLLHFFIPFGGEILNNLMIFLFLIFLFPFIYVGIWSLGNYTSLKEKNRVLWDITPSFQKFYSRKVNFIIYMFLLVEVWLKLFGSSILIW